MIIFGADIITGDGRTVLPEGFLLVQGDRIVGVGPGPAPSTGDGEAIDASGQLLIPGVIDSHGHACVPGPLNPSGAPALSLERVRAERDRHLLGGETTVLHLCGFCLQQEVELIGGHPLRVAVGTSHSRSCLRAAQLADGRGLSPAHLERTVEQRLSEGAAVIGEIGSGQTLGGGGVDYDIIPRTVERCTGVTLRRDQARQLKWAILGKRLTEEAFDRERTEECLRSMGLSGKLTAAEARQLLGECVLPPLRDALAGFEEAAVLSERTGRPAIMHACPVSVEQIVRLARAHPKARLVAAHCNQAEFEIEEAVKWCRRLREQGVTVDVSTWDTPTRAVHADPDRFLTLLGEGVVDTVSTDYAGGDWAPVLQGLAMALRAGKVGLARAVALATGNIARLLPEIAEDRGLLASGKLADVVLVDPHDIGAVRLVIVGGRIVARGDRVLQE